LRTITAPDRKPLTRLAAKSAAHPVIAVAPLFPAIFPPNHPTHVLYSAR
jgi:hypothetical protein